MSATFRTLVIGAGAASRNLLARLIDGSDIVIDDVIEPDQVVASVARRAPDLFVIDADCDAPTLAMICGLLKANPATVLLPLLAIAKSAKQRIAAFEAGVDDFLTHAVRFWCGSTHCCASARRAGNSRPNSCRTRCSSAS